MARKRSATYLGDSDDDFQMSDADEDNTFSRLKRTRRFSRRPAVSPDYTPDNSDFLDDDASSVQAPQLSKEDDRSMDASEHNSAPSSPKHEKEEGVVAVEDSGAEEVGEENEGDEPDRAESEDAIDDHSNDAESEAPPPPKRKLKVRQTYIESESEEEPDEDDGDEAYDGGNESPDEDDSGSEFEASPKKPVRKRETKAQAKAPETKAAAPKRKATVSQLKRAAPKSVSTPFRSTSVNKRGSNKSPASGRKVLGARMPFKSSISLKPNQPRKSPSINTPSRTKGPVIRSGLSRNAAIPRLHSYLPG